MSGLQFVTIVMVCVAGTLVVFTRDPLRQVIVAGIFGLLLAILFFTYQAPDVALSQLVVSTVAVPIMVLLALVHIRRDADEREEVAGPCSARSTCCTRSTAATSATTSSTSSAAWSWSAASPGWR